MSSAGKDYFRPRGDITTVLDVTDRDAQDNTYFPLDTDGSWFHHEEHARVYPTALSIQEFPHRGPAEWGQFFTFEVGSLHAGDLLHSIMLQIQLGSWYNPRVLYQLYRGELTTDVVGSAESYWTFCNSLGTSLVEYADLVVGGQTVERLTGEWIRVALTLGADTNSLTGLSTDAIGAVPYSLLEPSEVVRTAFHPRRPFPVEDGMYYCILPFFFLRTRLAQSFPLLSCNEGSVRVDIKLRPFEEMVRRFVGYRANAMDTPLGKSVAFLTAGVGGGATVTTDTAACAPDFRDLRVVTACSLLSGGLRQKFLRQPFEQLVKLVQPFSFEEPLKYLVSKPNPRADTVEIQLPLELNHPVVELVWVMRRKGVRVNNEWTNFTPVLGMEATVGRKVQPWISQATIRINGQELISAEGDWFRDHIAGVHRSGYTAYQSYVYGYSFSRAPEDHQPSGSANMSRSTSVTLRLSVRTPMERSLDTLPSPCVFDPNVVQGWEVFVFAVHYQWLRFQNGMCERLFT